MSTVSKISNAPRGCEALPAAATPKREPLRRRRRRLREEYASTAPPKPRRRIREAHRWLDVLTVRCTNGRVCERRPGARHISFYESAEIQEWKILAGRRGRRLAKVRAEMQRAGSI